MKEERSENRRIIYASEISEYSFCPRAWYLKRFCGIEAESEAMRKGEKEHERAVGKASAAEAGMKIAKIIVAVAMALLILSMLLWSL
jgi:CRISPR/Cas system-associated exonuclease Cas4 (RecB family)